MDEREAATVLKALLFFFRRSGYDVVSAAECSLKQNVKKKMFFKSDKSNSSSNWQVSLCCLSCVFAPPDKSG